MGDVSGQTPQAGAPTHSAFSLDDPRFELLQRVIVSRTFIKSPRLTKFLQFICLQLIEGRDSEINEQQIGIHVFGRSEAYNTSDDSIVRVQARLLRQRLEEYFEHESPNAAWIITIPKGGYVPVFEARSAIPIPASDPLVPDLSSQEEKTAAIPARLRPVLRARAVWMLAFLSCVVLAGLFSYLWKLHHRLDAPAKPLWSQFFSPGNSVIIVASDDALELFQEFTGKSVLLNEYLSGSYVTDTTLPNIGKFPMNAEWFTDHQLTSSVDLALALRLGRLPEAAKVNLETKNAHVLRMADLKGRNVVLIGGVAANPWVGLFADRLNFDVNVDRKATEIYVLNKHPRPGEKPMYREEFFGNARKSYGLFAYLPGIDGDGEVLLFEGTDMAGTESAADFPFSTALFGSFARTIAATASHIPYFEVLLETTSEGGNAPEAHVVAYRLIQP